MRMRSRCTRRCPTAMRFSRETVFWRKPRGILRFTRARISALTVITIKRSNNTIDLGNGRPYIGRAGPIAEAFCFGLALVLGGQGPGVGQVGSSRLSNQPRNLAASTPERAGIVLSFSFGLRYSSDVVN